jgi:predicted Zn-ribbon and HTH transcriptional regulator
MVFDNQGNLIFPKGAIENFREEMKKSRYSGRTKTGVWTMCSKCGHRWERRTKKAGKARCHTCNNWIDQEALE